MNAPQTVYIGVDVSKDSLRFDIPNLLVGEVPNTASKIKTALGKLQKKAGEGNVLHICLEATGPYGELLVGECHQAGIRVSVVNPAKVRHFAKAISESAKTDPIDARVIRLFAQARQPHPTPPPNNAEVLLRNVRVPASNIILGEGRGFEIAQGRLGPGRIHHCMRSIGAAERALELMCKRLNTRVAFGKPVAAQSVWHERVAESRIRIEQARLLTLKAAYMMDTVGNKAAKAEIAMIKVVAPNVALQVIDWAIQAHGAAGVSQDFPLAYAWAHQRTLRLADGPDEVHRNAIAKLELARHVLTAPHEVEMPITRGC